MASVFVHGRKVWARILGHKVPGKWDRVATEYPIGKEADALRWAKRTEDAIRERGNENGPLTLARYATGDPYGGRNNWIERRKADGVESWYNEESKLRLHILPALGHMAIAEIRFVHVRDFVHALIRSKKLSARTLRETYATLSRLFITAVEDEIIESTPCLLRRGSRSLPKRRDADPTWRGEATYTQPEVERLISDPALPEDARVLYAVKSIAMCRHGEIAAMRIEDYDPTSEPLGRLKVTKSWDSRKRRLKGTKSGEPRDVPVHPTLAKILAEWILSGWARVYGRAPKPSDLLVPNLALGHLDGPVAGRRFPRHLKALGLRVRAGARRNRGGHDLRSWGFSKYKELGADDRILKLSSHGERHDVAGGYTRGMWIAQCEQISKLKIERLDGEVIALSTAHSTRSAAQLNYWGKRSHARGQQPAQTATSVPESAPNHADANDRDEPTQTNAVLSRSTALDALAAAVLAGDLRLARKLARAARPAVAVTAA